MNPRVLLLLLVFAPSLFANDACEVLFGGLSKPGLELPTVRILDQGCSSTCWITAYLNYLETYHLNRTGKAEPLSQGYLVREYLLDQGIRHFKYEIKKMSEESFVAEAHRVFEKYGAVPDAAWKPSREPKTWGIRKALEQITELNKKNHKQGLTDEQARKAIEDFLNQKFGTPPERFTVEGKEYSPLDYGAGYASVDYHQQIVRSPDEKGISEELAKRIEDYVVGRLDRKIPVLFSYERVRALDDHGTGWMKMTPVQADVMTPDARHSGLVVGVKRDEQGHFLAWKIMTTWGPGHGDQGYYFMDWNYFKRMIFAIGDFEPKTF